MYINEEPTTMTSSLLFRSHRCVGGRNIRYTREQQRKSPYQQQQQQQLRLRQQQEQQRYEQATKMAASAHVYAQKLNNISAMSIEIGNYDKAISSLGKALKLIEVHTTDQLLDRSTACTCTNCSLDGCIAHTEQDSNLIEDFDINNRKRRNDNNKNLYQKPIRISKQAIREGHNMGSTLFLIITFNLALAHHLKLLKKMKTSSSSSSSSSLLNTTVKLYELASNWQQQHPPQKNDNYVVTDYDDDDDSLSSSDDDDDECDTMFSTLSITEDANTCISGRFNTILYNNLNQLMMMSSSDENDDDGASQRTKSSTERRLDDLLSSTANFVRLANARNRTEQHQSSSQQSRRVSHCDDDELLKFEYYSKSEEDEFFEQQQGKRLRH